MIKSEKVFLFLLISICLFVSIILVDAVIDPAVLISTVFASANNSPELVPESLPLLTPEEATQIIQDGWEVFRSDGYAFEIQFPKAVVRKTLLNQDALNAGIGVDSEAPVWEFTLDNPALYQGTNLVDASLVIHVLKGEQQIGLCSEFKPGSIYQTPSQKRDSLQEVDINGIPFWKDEVLEGVMGGMYRLISYRTVANGACYELTQLVHYQNSSSFLEGEITPFDEKQVLTELDQVLDTFSLLDVEPTFPEQSYPLPKTMSFAAPKNISDHVDGIDVSHWQGDIKWRKVGDAGIEFAFVKGTEGVGWTDVNFHENMNSGQDSGVVRGVYHFARPNLGNSGAEEANYFLSVAGDYLNSGYLRPVLDLEVGSSLGKTALSNWVLDYMETIKNRTGIEPLIYTNLNYVNNFLTNAVTDYDLWIAYWSCEPEPTYFIPPTGKWSDWAFWQYFGPGGCGSNAGFIPGIQTDIDLNIFNGVSAGLQEYDASSHLWVSMSSDAYFSPIPYYADISANVNGDTTGPIDFSFWWDCDALEADVATVESACGVLPAPEEGQCQQNEYGQKCNGVENDVQLAEHTYPEIGNYTAKVIVERGAAVPAEDRYKITTYYPIRDISLKPKTPGSGDVNAPYILNAEVEIHTSVEGVLQVSIAEIGSEEIIVEDCHIIESDVRITEEYPLVWAESETAEKFYDIWTRYRPWGDCPIVDPDDNDLYRGYQIIWDSVNSHLELQHPDGTPLPSGSTDDLGDLEHSQIVELEYIVYNPSTVSSLQITAGTIENPVNIINPQLTPSEPLTVGPEEDQFISITFEIENPEAFSFDVVLEHDASNPSPYTFTVEGNGVIATNPIKSVSPVPPSPGESLIGESFTVNVEVEVDAPIAGVLQVSLEDQEGGEVQDPQCLLITGAGQNQHSFDITWVEPEVGVLDYTIWTQYRAEGECPVEDTQDTDISQSYQVSWEEENPVLELNHLDGTPLQTGSVDDLGDLEPYQIIEIEYVVHNPTSTNNFQIATAGIENPVNILDPQLTPSGTIVVGPGEEQLISITFEIDNTGPFSFDVVLEHDASNPSPYTFTVGGNGVMTANPIQSVSSLPISPGESLIGESYSLQINVVADAPISGVLQVSLEDQEGGEVQDPLCLVIADAGQNQHSFDFTWVEPEVGIQDYTIWTRYRAREGCPVEDTQDSDIFQSYQVNWEEDSPILELQHTDGLVIPAGEVIENGQFEYYKNIELDYLVYNTSTTSNLIISDIYSDNLVNLSEVSTSPSGSIEVSPGESLSLTVSFLVNNTGSLSFDLVLDHDASNPTPYRVTIEGMGVMINNPIKFVSPNPTSPGNSLIGDPYQLSVDVGIEAPDQGALQISLVEVGTDVIRDQECLALVDNLNSTRTFNLSWNNMVPGNVEYTLWTRYRAQGGCPIEDALDSDLSQIYRVTWEEEIPVLELQNPDGTVLPADSTDDVGQVEFFQQMDLNYIIHNTSTTTSMQVGEISVENLVNLSQVNVDTTDPITVGPDGQYTISVSFLVNNTGPFAFDLNLDHDASNISPYRITIQGVGEMTENPIQFLSIDPIMPGTGLIFDSFQLQVVAEVDPPAPGALEVSLVDQGSSTNMGQACISLIDDGKSINIFDLSWTETAPGDVEYSIRIRYQAQGNCPLEGSHDAELTEPYWVSWLENRPTLEVKRPEGVTIFDGSVDYVGEHDFFRIVEVMYVIENESTTSPMTIERIHAENLVNLRSVNVEPAGPIEIGPGEMQTIKITFQVLVVKPYSFDLLWEHDASNQSPYQFVILGDANLNLYGYPIEPWMYDFIINLINSEIFLKFPHLVLVFTRNFESMDVILN